MNTQSIEKSMNGTKSLTDGEITITEGAIVFSDGSVLDSIENIALLNADNVMTGSNTFTGDVKINSATGSSTYEDGALVVSGGVGIAENLRVNGRAIFNDLMAVYDNVYFSKLLIVNENIIVNENVIVATAPSIDTHLTNKLYVDTAIATETESILANDNTFTGSNTFSNNITSASIPVIDSDLTNKLYVDTAIATETDSILANDNTFTGSNTFNNNIITLAEIPVLDTHLTNKLYVDTAITQETISILASDNTFTGNNGFSGITNIINTTDATSNGTSASLKIAGGTWVAKHIQLPAVGAGIRLGDYNKGICYSNQSSLQTGTDAQYYNIGDGIAVFGWADGCLGTRYTTGEAGTNDKSILYWNRYGQVGINNNSPEYNLDVVGSSRITESLNVGGISNFSSDVNITAETSSTGYLNGALTVAGGVGIAENLRVNGVAAFYDIMAVYKGASFSDTVNITKKLDVFEGANIRLTTTLATANITTLNVSGEAYVGGKITMENNVNNKKLVLYEPAVSVGADPLTAENFYGFGVNGGTLRYQVHTSEQFHKFYCGSTLNLEVGNQTLYMSGSINGLYIEGADNGTTQQSVIIDCNNGTNVAKLKAGKGENYVIGKNNLASYNSTVLYQGSNNVVLGKDNLNAQTNQSFNTAVGCSIFTKTTGQFNTGMGLSVFKETTTGGYNVGLGYNPFSENIIGTNNIGIGFWAGRYSLGSYNTFLGDQTKTNNGGSYNNSTALGAGATITDSNQLVIGTTNALQNVVIPSTNATALTVGGGVSIGGNLIITNRMKLTGLDTDNIYIGENSQQNTTGQRNVSLGSNNFIGLTSGLYNTAIGYGAGTGSNGLTKETTGTYNTFIGALSGTNGVYNGSTAIGFGSTITDSFQVVLGRTSDYIKIPSPINSTNSTTGALQVAGGVGIQKNLTVGNDLTVNDNLIVNDNFNMTGGVFNAISTGLGSVGGVLGTYTDFYQFPAGAGVYIFYINRCAVNGVGVLSSTAQDANTSRVKMIVIGTTGTVKMNDIGGGSGYIDVSIGTANQRKITATITGIAFTYTYWYNKIF